MSTLSGRRAFGTCRSRDADGFGEIVPNTCDGEAKYILQGILNLPRSCNKPILGEASPSEGRPFHRSRKADTKG